MRPVQKRSFCTGISALNLLSARSFHFSSRWRMFLPLRHQTFKSLAKKQRKSLPAATKQTWHTPDTDGISTSAEQLELCGQRGQDGDASSHFRLWARAFRRHEARERARRAGPLWHYQSRREVLLERLPRTYPIRTRRCRYAPPSGLSDGKTLVCAVQLFATASSASVRNNCLWAHQRRLVPRAAAPPRIVCSRASLPLRPSHEVTQRAAVNGRRQGGG